MNAQEIISTVISPLSQKDNFFTAIGFLEEYKVYHLPVVDISNNEFIGILSEKDIYEVQNPDKKIENELSSLKEVFVRSNSHLLDVLKEMGRHRMDCIAVVDEKYEYIGSITYESIFENLFDVGFFIQDGCILVIELNQNDYSMTHIANIIESNNAKILYSCVKQIPESKNIMLSLKINLIDPSPIINAFERYNYTIYTYCSEETENSNLLEERYNELINYLNV